MDALESYVYRGETGPLLRGIRELRGAFDALRQERAAAESVGRRQGDVEVATLKADRARLEAEIVALKKIIADYEGKAKGPTETGRLLEVD